MKIDIHTHIMPEHMPRWTEKFGYGEFIHLEHRNCKACMIKGDKVFREVSSNCFKAEERLKDMEQTGVTRQVISPIPVLFNYWAKPEHGLETSRFFNDNIAETVQKNRDQFTGLGTVPMQDPELAMKELERCRKELGLPGIEIGTNINQENLSDPKYIPFFELAEKLECSIFVHPWEMMGFYQIRKYWLPWLVSMPAETSRAICSLIFSGIFEKFPGINFAFAHGGGSFPATLGRVEHGFHCRPDLCAVDNDKAPKNYIGKFWIDSLVHDPIALNYVTEVMGEDFICLGSDYPFPLGEQHPGKLVEGMNWDEEKAAKFLHGNALRWLRMSHS